MRKEVSIGEPCRGLTRGMRHSPEGGDVTARLSSISTSSRIECWWYSLRMFWKVLEKELSLRKCITKGGSLGEYLACPEMEDAHGCGTFKEGLYILGL